MPSAHVLVGALLVPTVRKTDNGEQASERGSDFMKPFATEKKKCIYEAIVHVDLNITTSHRKCSTLNPPFLSTSESLKFKRLS